MGFNQNLNFRNVFVPLRPLLVCFRNGNQFKVTFSYWYSIIFYGGGWKGDQILKYRFSFTVIKKESPSNIFLITSEEAMLLEFSFYFSKICNMFLTKVQQSYCYTKLCNYREEIAPKPISNTPNILVCCN